MFELSHLHPNIIIVHRISSWQRTDQILPRSRFVSMSGKQEILLVDAAEHIEPFRADHSELLVLVVSQIEQFLEVQELQIHLEVCTGVHNLQRNCPGLTW